MKNCFEGYLTAECKDCPFWKDGSSPMVGIGCACPFPIMRCDSFRKEYEKEYGKEK